MHDRTVIAGRGARRRWHGPAPVAAALFAATLAGACGHSDAAPHAAAAPSRAGTVWELDRAGDRSVAAASLLAFVNGLDVMVVDGNDLYTGTTHRTAATANDVRTVQLPNGLSAALVPNGDALELRFSSGDSVPLRKRTVSGSGGR